MAQKIERERVSGTRLIKLFSLLYKRRRFITIGSIASIISIFTFLSPNILIEPVESVYQYDAHSTFFLVKNNSYLPLWNVRIGCLQIGSKAVPHVVQLYNRVGFGGSIYLGKGDGTSAKCFNPIKARRLDGKAIPTHSAEFIIEVTFWRLPLHWIGIKNEIKDDSYYLPTTDTLKHLPFIEGLHRARFYTRRDSGGVIKWFQKSLNE